jgi:hypothetical protein
VPAGLAAALQAVKDPFIWVPNGVGGVFAVLLIALSSSSRGKQRRQQQDSKHCCE